MGRRRNKKKKKNSQRNAASQNVTTPASPASKPATNDAEVKESPEPAAVAAAPATATASASGNSPVTPVAPDAPWETWPALQDRGQNPVRLPYDHGGIPLLLLLFYMTFLGFAMTYMANWLVPDLLNYFFTE